jgi:molecular chaperone GrpE
MSKTDKENKAEDPQMEDTATATPEVNVEQQKDEKTKEVQLEEQLAEEKDKFMRLFAEFENYKKRTIKERMDLFKTASQDVMQAMLPIIDDFERALTHIEEANEAKELGKGVALIYNKLVNTLEQKGLSKIEVEQGDTFNADDHEAVTQIPAPSPELKGKIIDVLERGYKLGDKVIRFPKVVIGQ